MTGQKKPHSQSLAAESAVQSSEKGFEYGSVSKPFSVSDDSTSPVVASNDGQAAAARGGDAGRVTVEDWISWLRAVGFQPRMFLTLTYDNRYSEMPAEWVRSTWKWLVHKLNHEIGGNQYKRKFKHSYFSYVMALEYQKRGALHIHALIENPSEAIRYMRIHELWSPKFGGRYGFAWLSHVPNPKLTGLGALKAGSEDAALRYVLKYVLKDSSPLVWIKKKRVEVRTVDLKPAAASAVELGGPAEWVWQVIEAEVERLAQLELGIDGTV